MEKKKRKSSIKIGAIQKPHKLSITQLNLMALFCFLFLRRLSREKVLVHISPLQLDCVWCERSQSCFSDNPRQLAEKKELI